MIRLGVVDFDTSHVVEFTKRFNHVDVAEEQWVQGAKVVVGCPGKSVIFPERIAGYRDQMKKYGVPLVDKPEEMIGQVDAVIVHSNEGAMHLDHVKWIVGAGLPCFVDKPFANSATDAKAMADLAAKKKVLLWSSSSLRFTPELVGYLADPKPGSLLGAASFGPAQQHERNPGLYHYGIHAVEILYTLMGPGCTRVTATFQKDADVVTGTWKDGRVGTVRGCRGGRSDYGFTAFAAKETRAVALSTKFMYREHLGKIVEGFTTGKAPVDIGVTVELIAFIEAANKSGANHGAAETVKV